MSSTAQSRDEAAAEAAAREFTIDDLRPSIDRRAQLRRTPKLARDAITLVWKASPTNLVLMIGLNFGSGLFTAGQLLVAQHLMKSLVRVTSGADPNVLFLPLLAFTIATAALAVLGSLTAVQQQLVVEFTARRAFDQIVATGSAVRYTMFETPAFYDKLQRAQHSGEFRIVDMVNAVSQLIAALLTTISIAVVLFVLSPILLVLVVVAAVPAFVASVRNSRESYAFEYAMTAESRERAYMLGLLTNRNAAKEVRLFELGEHLRERYVALSDERLRQLRVFLRKRLRVSIFGGVSGAIGMALALVALIVLLHEQAIGVATALTAGLAMQQLAGRLSAITGSVARLIESGMFIDDYRAFLELAPVVEESETPRHSRPRAGRLNHLRVDGVSFRYPRAPTLAVDDASLEIGPGETVALVGANGSGKTTLVKLLCGLYTPLTGRVLWNGADTAALDPASITSEITVLFQDYIGYHLPVLDNIVFGRVSRGHDLSMAIQAARRAGAHDFVERLPHDYGTRLGLQFEGGHELSVGQWQRLALARAFFRDGSFLILDEPTAALDPRAERDLFQQIRALTRGQSTLLISHRFSSVRSADRIYVMSSGRIVESGTHSALIARGGLYAELFEMQAAGYAASDEALRQAEA